MPGLQASHDLAAQVGEKLGAGQILQRRVPADEDERFEPQGFKVGGCGNGELKVEIERGERLLQIAPKRHLES